MKNADLLLTLDGSYFSEGGAILRTALIVSCLIKQNIRIQKIRHHERKSGINSEDLAIINLLALSTKADLIGNQLGSSELIFKPKQNPNFLNFELCMDERAKGKEQGNITTILSTTLLVLAKTKNYSNLTVKTHTHSSSGSHYDFLEHLVLNLYRKQGIHTSSEIRRTTFDKNSTGEVFIEIEPSVYLSNRWKNRGMLKTIKIILSEYNIAPHIQKTIINQVYERIKVYKTDPFIQIIPLNSKDSGLGLTILAEFENGLGGFSMCQAGTQNFEDEVQGLYQQFEEWMESQTTLSPNLLSYALIPMVFATEINEENPGTIFTASQLEPEAETIIWTLKQMLPLKLTVIKTPEENMQISFQPS